MGDRLLEGRAAQRLVARLAPPFDGEIVETGLGEMMGDRLGLGACASTQHLGGAAMQRLAAALEQAVVGRVLDQRVLEAIVGLGGAPSTNSRSASASRSNDACSAGSSISATSRSSA